MLLHFDTFLTHLLIEKMKNICTFVPQSMKRKIVNIFTLAWGLMMSTDATWESIAGQEGKPAFKTYVRPWVILCVVISFVFDAFYSDSKPFTTGFLSAVITAVSMFGAYFLTRYFVLSFVRKNWETDHAESKIETLVAYSFTVFFAIKLVVIVIPSLFFLQILNIYTAYLVWEGARILLNVDEDNRGKIMLITSLSVIFIPGIISRVIHFMIPGF